MFCAYWMTDGALTESVVLPRRRWPRPRRVTSDWMVCRWVTSMAIDTDCPLGRALSPIIFCRAARHAGCPKHQRASNSVCALLLGADDLPLQPHAAWHNTTSTRPSTRPSRSMVIIRSRCTVLGARTTSTRLATSRLMRSKRMLAILSVPKQSCTCNVSCSTAWSVTCNLE
jgi:hypothetical protein